MPWQRKLFCGTEDKYFSLYLSVLCILLILGVYGRTVGQALHSEDRQVRTSSELMESVRGYNQEGSL